MVGTLHWDTRGRGDCPQWAALSYPLYHTSLVTHHRPAQCPTQGYILAKPLRRRNLEVLEMLEMLYASVSKSLTMKQNLWLADDFIMLFSDWWVYISISNYYKTRCNAIASTSEKRKQLKFFEDVFNLNRNGGNTYLLNPESLQIGIPVFLSHKNTDLFIIQTDHSSSGELS